MTYKHVWHETVIHVANNSKWHTSMFDMKQLSMWQKQMAHKHFRHETVTICGKQQQMTHKHFWHETVIHVANNSKWHTSIFDMKQLSICGKQQQMTHKHFWHETVIHMWQTTANDIQACLTWNSYPYVANNSKWHTNIFDMKQLSIWQTTANDTQAFSTWNSYHMWQTTANDIQACLTWKSYPYVANNSTWPTNIFYMKQLSMWQTTTYKHVLTWNSYPCGKQQQMTYKHVLPWNSYPCGKQQQMTYRHVGHETVIHMWQTTANDTQAFLTWNSYPYVANNSKWHTRIFDMKQLSMCGKQQEMTYKHVWDEKVIHMWQTTANDTQAFLTWNSYPCVANITCWTWKS